MTSASTFSSASLCKSHVCCHFGGPRWWHFPLRVLCHDMAGESHFQRVRAACQESRACRGGWGHLGSTRRARVLVVGCWGEENF